MHSDSLVSPTTKKSFTNMMFSFNSHSMNTLENSHSLYFPMTLIVTITVEYSADYQFVNFVLRKNLVMICIITTTYKALQNYS